MSPQNRRSGGRRQRESRPVVDSLAKPTPASSLAIISRPTLPPFRSRSFPNLHELSYLAVSTTPSFSENTTGNSSNWKLRPFPASPFPTSPTLDASFANPIEAINRDNTHFRERENSGEESSADDDDAEEEEQQDDEAEDDEDDEDDASFERQFLSPISSESEDEDSIDDENDDDDANQYRRFGNLDGTDAARATSAEASSLHSGVGSPVHRSDAHLLRTKSLKQRQPLRSSLSAASRSQSSLGPPSFAPPFYNRPPTPLPPSPSLTSLLRPGLSFSTLPSRPATPDSSDTEATHAHSTAGGSISGVTGTAASAVAASALLATTVPRASPKVPTYEYYGFVVYLGSSLAFIMYLLWSYLPTPILHQLGIYYYPDRWWSLAIPSWLVIAICYIYVALAAWNTGIMTLGLTSLECFVDEKAQVAMIDAQGRIIRQGRFSKTSDGFTRKQHKGSKKGKHRNQPNGHKTAYPKEQVRVGAPSTSSHNSSSIVTTQTYGRQGIGMRRSKSRPLPDLNWKNIWSHGTDGVMDVPIGGVCEILYGSTSSPSSTRGDNDNDDDNEGEFFNDRNHDDNCNNSNNSNDNADKNNNIEGKGEISTGVFVNTTSI